MRCRPRALSARVVFCAWITLSCGCFRPICKNGPLRSYDPKAGYRFETLRPGTNNSDETFVCLTFSGGGTRAAAVAYGVLQALYESALASRDGAGAESADPTRPPRTLLDEVDVISSVSGGSFTAMTYALERERIFDGRFEREFLKQNIERKIVGLLLNIRNLLALPYVLLDRIDVAASYFDENVFHRKTYQALLDRGDRPFVVVNATNVALEQQFQFTQDEFDLLGADLSTLPAGYAVGASSAFPLLFSPLRLKYHESPFHDRILRDVLDSPTAQVADRRRYAWAKSLLPKTTSSDSAEFQLDTQAHRYLYLLDGGLSDNLGLTWVLEQLHHGLIRERLQAGSIKRLIVIIVDAGTEPPEEIENHDSAPGLFLMGVKSASTGIDNLSQVRTDALSYLLRELPAELRVLDERNRQSLAAHCSPDARLEHHYSLSASTYLIDLNFRSIRDEELRSRCLSMPTRLFLSNRSIDELMQVGRQLVQQHPEYDRLMKDAGAKTVQTGHPND